MQTATVVRPRQQLAPPVRLDPAFSDPEAVVDLIEKGSPYKTLSAGGNLRGVVPQLLGAGRQGCVCRGGTVLL